MRINPIFFSDSSGQVENSPQLGRFWLLFHRMVHNFCWNSIYFKVASYFLKLSREVTTTESLNFNPEIKHHSGWHWVFVTGVDAAMVPHSCVMKRRSSIKIFLDPCCYIVK